VFTAAFCSGSALRLSRTASPSSGSSRPRRSLAAARRRRRGTQLALPCLPFPGPFPLAAAHTRVRGKPQRGLVGCDCDPRLSYRVSVKAVWGQKVQGASLLVAMARWPTWLLASGGQASFGITGQGQKRAFPQVDSPGRVARVLASACARAGLGMRAHWPRHARQLSAGYPIRARGRGASQPARANPRRRGKG
jgi:hypothetical protein